MSLYQVQQCLYNYLRTLEAVEAGIQIAVIIADGVPVQYLMGIHPVIINGYCRAMGYRRADYRELLKPLNNEPKRKTRWQTS